MFLIFFGGFFVLIPIICHAQINIISVKKIELLVDLKYGSILTMDLTAGQY